jgi:hypothetical protein
MAKLKVPKGTKNIDCIRILPTDVQKEYIDMYGRRNQGDPEVRQWADAQKFEYELWRARMDMHIIANHRLGKNVLGHSKGLWEGALSAFVPDRFEGTSFTSVEGRAHSIAGKLNSILSEMLDKYKPRMLGFSRDREGMKNVVREVFNKNTGDQEAAEMAQAWKKMAEYVRKRLVANGASIGKIADDGWGMPQYHDPSKVAAIGREPWMELLYEHLDWEKMVKNTGLDRDALEDLIRWDVFDSIVTDGASKIDLERISGKPQGQGLLSRLQQHRLLYFKDGDAWLDYQDAAGHSDYLTAMTDFVRSQSINIAAMEVLGPNPEIGYQHVRNLLKTGGLENKLDWLDNVYKNVMGNIGTSDQKAASHMAGIRGFNVMAHLGNATLSMITDPAFLTMTARINDVPAYKAILRQLKMAAGQGVGASGDFKFANQLGFTAEYAADRLLAAARFTDVAPHKYMARASEMTVRASFMHAITTAGRAAFALEYSAALARDSGKTFSELSKRRIAAFNRVGITEQDWDRIRMSQKATQRGVEYVDINYVGSGGGRETATKLGALVNQEMNYAVPMPGAEQRAWQNQGLKRGTVKGEAWRSVMEFKSFPITILMMHGRRIMHQKAMNKYAYGGSMIAMLLMLGSVATDSKDVSRGRDPGAWFNDDGTVNWKQAGRVAAQSGGLGIYGDILFHDQTQFGMSIASTLGGPTSGLLQDTTALSQASLYALIESLGGEDDEKAKQLKKIIGRDIQKYKPEIWQFRALEDRAINQALNWWTDDEWDRSLRRSEKRRAKEMGQENYWAEDAMLPERAPERGLARP